MTQSNKVEVKQTSPAGTLQEAGKSASYMEQPNHFELHGKNKKIKIVYDSTSITGKPQFTYEENGVAQHFEHKEIWDETTEIGRLVFRAHE